jgi:hypothetical protein
MAFKKKDGTPSKDRSANWYSRPDSPFLTIAGAALVSGLPMQFIRKVVLQGLIPTLKVNKKVVFIRRTDLENWIAGTK